MLISLVITVWNENDTLDEFIRRVRITFEELPEQFEIIFVDDASHDGSFEKLVNYAQKDSRIKILRMSRKFGRHECFFAGFAHASGDAVIMMDSDLQDPPELIRELIDVWKIEKADIVYTTMLSRAGESIIKQWLFKVSYYILSHICYINMPRNAGMFKLLSRKAVQAILTIHETDSYFKGLINWIGFKQVPVFFDRQARYAGESHFTLLGLRPLQDFMKALTSFSYILLYLPFVLGIVLFLISSCILIFKILVLGEFREFLIIFTSFEILIFLAISSTILFSIGLLGIYLHQIHASTRHRPRYIIDTKYGFSESKDYGNPN